MNLTILRVRPCWKVEIRFGDNGQFTDVHCLMKGKGGHHSCHICNILNETFDKYGNWIFCWDQFEILTCPSPICSSGICVKVL